MAAAAAPTSMPQARPRSAMEATQVNSIPDAMHTAAMGSVMAGSAFSARKTCCARPETRAFRSCFAPTTIRSWARSGKDPHFGILLFFLVSIQIYIIRTFSEKSTEIFAIFPLFFRLFSWRVCPRQFDIIPFLRLLRNRIFSLPLPFLLAFSMLIVSNSISNYHRTVDSIPS